MQRFVMHYPGDPPIQVLKLTRQEFLERHPRYPIRMGPPGGPYEEFPVARDEVVCDFCNADPGDVVWLYNDMRGYCEQCARENWFEYLTPNPEPKEQ